MQIEIETEVGQMLLVCPTATEERLAKTCFRGKGRPLAGNFARWTQIEQVCSDSLVQQALLDFAVDMFDQGRIGFRRLTVTAETDIGWESTDTVDLFSPDELEDFEPNSRSRAKRVILPSRLGRKAPKTNLVTFALKLTREEGALVVSILTVYPGVDIENVSGPVTENTGRVFYDWDHPGE